MLALQETSSHISKLWEYGVCVCVCVCVVMPMNHESLLGSLISQALHRFLQSFQPKPDVANRHLHIIRKERCSYLYFIPHHALYPCLACIGACECLPLQIQLKENIQKGWILFSSSHYWYFLSMACHCCKQTRRMFVLLITFFLPLSWNTWTSCRACEMQFWQKNREIAHTLSLAPENEWDRVAPCL